MKWWITETDIDGFRCDVAGMVPNDFWKKAIDSLEATKDVFMLAEWDEPKMHEAGFDMTYGWEYHHILNDIATGKANVDSVVAYLNKDAEKYDSTAFRMYFTSNHDENSWNGTVGERMGANGQNFHVLASTLPQSMPLIYSGQEAGLNKRLAFFEKEHIDWTDSSQTEFYTKLTHLKLEHPTLVNGSEQGGFERIDTGNDRVYAFKRMKDDAELLVYVNLADQSFVTTAPLEGDAQYEDVMNGEAVNAELSVPPQSFKLISTSL
jgi:glycosidase